MRYGKVLAIYTAPRAGAPMVARPSAEAVAGRGLEGDRYAEGNGSFSRWPGSHREATLIAAEALEALAAETGAPLAPEHTRRNILTAGLDVRALVGRRFRIGEALFEGVRLCQPCKYLARLTGRPDLVGALRDRGGVRCRILETGRIAVGDAVREAAGGT